MASAPVIDDLLSRWQQCRANGESTSVEDLCLDHPELREELQKRIEALQRVEIVMADSCAATPVNQPPTIDHGEPGPDVVPAPLPVIPDHDVRGRPDEGGMGTVWPSQRYPSDAALADALEGSAQTLAPPSKKRSGITLEELRRAVLKADPAAVLVPPRLLARVLRDVRQLPNQFFQVPHRDSTVIDRHVLFRHAEQDELRLEPDRLLPQTVILLAQPSAEALRQRGRDALLRSYWQRLFHANIHVALERKWKAGELNDELIRARIEEIGTAEFVEIRTVLGQEQYLGPDATDRETYFEFAAVYLELRYFLTNLRSVYFPAVGEFARIDRLLSRDVHADLLFARTRLFGAADPLIFKDTSADEPADAYWRLVRAGEKADERGNVVRAAILRSQAADIAPEALGVLRRLEALHDLERLIVRLQAALQLEDNEVLELRKTLPSLLDKTDQGHWTAEARLLYDLQKVCVDHERVIYSLDVVEWAMSGGKRPIKRPLPGQRIVRLVKHLSSAARRLTMTRISDSDREQIAKLLQKALHESEARLRERFRPVLTDALGDVGLRPHNAPERTALAKMVEELLDRIIGYGFLTFSDLRDAISRNNLKLADVTDPQEYVRGDLLLRLDRRLAVALDGVYRPSEVYLRLIQRMTSLNFGTRLGRAFTRWVSIPLGGAVLVLEVLELLLKEGHRWFGGSSPPVFAPLSLLFQNGVEGATLMPVVGSFVFLVLVAFIAGLVHSRAFRQNLRRLGRKTFRAVRHVAVELPARMVPLAAFMSFWRSWSFQLLYWYVLKPLALFVVLVWIFAEAFREDTLVRLASAFLAVEVFMNSRFGQAAGELLMVGLFQLFHWLRAGFLPGLYHLVVRVFKQITDALEYVLYSVDEWLRFRAGESELSLVVRTILGMVWFPVSYLARLYMVVGIEPGLNPLKLPATIVAAKLLLPVVPVVTSFLISWLTPVFGSVLAPLVATFHVFWVLPDVFGFLFWETKENWSLYEANRSRTLRPVVIGSHGEEMTQLLRPGFHSGTLPKLFAHLRQAERTACHTGIWRYARGRRQALEEIKESVHQFFQRELVNLLEQCPTWKDGVLSVGAVTLAGNRIAVELAHAQYPDVPLRLAFEEQAGWLVAGIQEVGWLGRLEAGHLCSLGLALAGLYKLAGVDLVREQVRANLPTEVTAYEITDSGLSLRLDRRDGPAVHFSLLDAEEMLPASSADADARSILAGLDAKRLVFAETPLWWKDWVADWQQGAGATEELIQSVLGDTARPV